MNDLQGIWKPFTIRKLPTREQKKRDARVIQVVRRKLKNLASFRVALPPEQFAEVFADWRDKYVGPPVVVPRSLRPYLGRNVGGQRWDAWANEGALIRVAMAIVDAAGRPDPARNEASGETGNESSEGGGER